MSPYLELCARPRVRSMFNMLSSRKHTGSEKVEITSLTLEPGERRFNCHL